ncbi:MAG: hypothetical protein AAF670_00520 [Planctomycetota bacterium]
MTRSSDEPETGSDQSSIDPIVASPERPNTAPPRPDATVSLKLGHEYIIETIKRLNDRIEDRFPQSGLSKLCSQLLNLARQSSARSRQIGRPILWIRISGYLLALALVASLVILVLALVRPGQGDAFERGMSITEFLQTAESGCNEMLLLGAGIYFLISLETRIKRRRSLKAVHELRSICHIIDMHQLTKDPERSLQRWQATANSPKQQMTQLQLNRYLDYCSEMLSLTGKIAALYVEDFDDAVSVAAVGEVESLSTALSRKIWQKIMILNQLTGRPAVAVAEDSGDEASP